MAKELKLIDVSNVPELLRLAQQVRDTQESCVLQQDSEELALITPVQRSDEPDRARKGRPVTEDDALFRLIGIGRSGATESVARNKHKHLADAYRRLHR